MMKRSVLLIVMACAAGAGCGGKKPAAKEPVAAAAEAAAPAGGHGSQLAVLLTSGKTYEVPELAGDVTCYEGTATLAMKGQGEMPGPEVYLRRAVDVESVTIVEDSVQITDGTVKRYVSTLVPSAGVDGLYDITEALGHWEGTEVAGNAQGESVQVVELTTGSIMVTAYIIDAAGMDRQSLVFSPGAIPGADDPVDIAEMIVKGGIDALKPYVGFVSGVLLKVMDPAACRAAFAAFPPEEKYF